MKNSNIKTLLFLTILATILLPLIAAFYFLDRALQTSLDLGFNPQIAQALEDASHNLKTLKSIDLQNEALYREQFHRIEELQQVYATPELVKSSIQSSLTIYFGLGLVVAVVLSILLAAALSRRIARSYRAAFNELSRQRERVRYLEEMSSWQELAKMLAHEIKNPLTPIEVLVTALSKAYLSKSQTEFHAQLNQTQTMINEELLHLKSTVDRFSEFARLPAVHLAEENLTEMLRQHVKAIGASFDAATIRCDVGAACDAVRVKLDATLFRQVLTNMVKNGIEANPARQVAFTVTLASHDDSIGIAISNDGAPVPTVLAPRIFDPYVSGKSGKDNMGLGLAIVRKIIIEHGGDIAYAEVQGRPTFTISLPKMA